MCSPPSSLRTPTSTTPRIGGPERASRPSCASSTSRPGALRSRSCAPSPRYEPTMASVQFSTDATATLAAPRSIAKRSEVARAPPAGKGARGSVTLRSCTPPLTSAATSAYSMPATANVASAAAPSSVAAPRAPCATAATATGALGAVMSTTAIAFRSYCATSAYTRSPRPGAAAFAPAAAKVTTTLTSCGPGSCTAATASGLAGRVTSMS
mmetsp:Transcript_5049/g.15755  ORF Transcript_5049/g.15755 Transcript_5049/m.15755 type:complete len:211 (-) Transcript_5049:714-1346(-)